MKTIRRPIETWTQIMAGFMIGLILSAFIWALITGKEPMKDNVMKDDRIEFKVSINYLMTLSENAYLRGAISGAEGRGPNNWKQDSIELRKFLTD